MEARVREDKWAMDIQDECVWKTTSNMDEKLENWEKVEEKIKELSKKVLHKNKDRIVLDLKEN